MKIVLPIAVLLVGVGGMAAINASADKEEEKESIDTRPTVRVETIEATSYQVMITSFGEVKPLESTQLSSQVSGEVVGWNPNFVEGGLVKRGDVLFTIEKDAYLAAVLQAEANLSSAQATLIEEQGRADVATQEAKSLPKNKITDLYLRKPQLMSAKAMVKSAKAALKLARRDLANCEVLAPYDALVVSRELGLGQFISTGARIGQLHNIEHAEVTFPIAGFDNAFLPQTLVGQQAAVSNKGRVVINREGQVVRDLGVVDTSTRMSHLVVRINDPYSLNTDQPALKFGSYVEVSFRGQKLDNVFRLSQDLISNRKLWIIDEEQKLESRQVEVIREEDEFFLISSGLTDSDEVVMTLPEYPQNGMEVRVAGRDTNEADDSSEQLAQVEQR